MRSDTARKVYRYHNNNHHHHQRGQLASPIWQEVMLFGLPPPPPHRPHPHVGSPPVRGKSDLMALQVSSALPTAHISLVTADIKSTARERDSNTPITPTTVTCSHHGGNVSWQRTREDGDDDGKRPHCLEQTIRSATSPRVNNTPPHPSLAARRST